MDHARYYEQDEKGVRTMSKILEDMRMEAAREAAQDQAKKIALCMIRTGKMPLEDIVSYTGLSFSVVKELEKQAMQLA